MKLKFIMLILVAKMFLLSGPSHAGIVEDQLAKQALNDLKDVINSIRPFAPSVAKRLNNIRVGLKERITRDEDNCATLEENESFSELILSRASGIQKKRCKDEETNRTFTPKFEHCLSMSDLKCVCSHEQHKDDPECAPFVNKGKGTREKKCIPQDIADNALERINQIINNLDTAFAVDSDGNGISDICEDNL